MAAPISVHLCVCLLALQFQLLSGLRRNASSIQSHVADDLLQKKSSIRNHRGSFNIAGSSQAHGRDNFNLDVEVCESCEGLAIDYLKFLQTSSRPKLTIAGMFGFGLFLVWLLSDTTEHFFTPPLLYWAELLKLRPEVAGATLLAIGNGAPDVSNSIAAATSHDLPLALSELLGSNLFCFCCTGASCIVAYCLSKHKQPQAFDTYRFLESLLWYFGGVALIIFILSDARVTRHEALLLPLVYLCFVARTMLAKGPATASPSAEDSSSISDNRTNTSIKGTANDSAETTRDEYISAAAVAAEGVKGIEKLMDGDGTLAGLSLPLVKTPLTVGFWMMLWPLYLIRWVTIPPSDKKWDFMRRSICACCPLGLTIFCMCTGLLQPSSCDGTWLTCNQACMCNVWMGVASLSGVIIFRIGGTGPELPWFYAGLTLVAKVSSILWLGMISNELTAMLESIAWYGDVSRLRIGFSVIAWGNTIGDCFTCIALAYVGQSSIAFAGIVAGPLFNNLIGLGLGLITAVSQVENEYIIFQGGRWPDDIRHPVAVGLVCVTFAVLIMALMGAFDSSISSMCWASMLYGTYAIFLAAMLYTTSSFASQIDATS